MTTRGSTAVMATKKPQQSASQLLNYFPTPPWAYRTLIHEIMRRPSFDLMIEPGETIWEPACGGGHGAIALSETNPVFGTDVHDWGYGQARDLDFSFATAADAPHPIDWVITNPPFTLAEMFLMRGLQIARRGVAMLVRLQWLEGEDRYRSIFGASGDAKPVLVCPFAERVPMIEGCWDPEAKTATAYCWIIWTIGGKNRDVEPWRLPQVFHIPPGMELRYTRADDELLANRGEAERRRLARTA